MDTNIDTNNAMYSREEDAVVAVVVVADIVRFVCYELVDVSLVQ